MKIRPPNLQGLKHKFLHTVGFRSFLLADDKHDCGSKPPYVLKKKKAKGRRHGRESANISREMGPWPSSLTLNNAWDRNKASMTFLWTIRCKSDDHARLTRIDRRSVIHWIQSSTPTPGHEWFDACNKVVCNDHFDLLIYWKHFQESWQRWDVRSACWMQA